MGRYIVDMETAKNLVPELGEFLDLTNQALRNINMGKMDHLPYYQAVPKVQVLMQAELSPQGAGRPPAVGHWQLLITKENKPFQICLHGKIKGSTERAEVIFVCPNSEEESSVARESEQTSGL